jgi:hypothetical protein
MGSIKEVNNLRKREQGFAIKATNRFNKGYEKITPLNAGDPVAISGEKNPAIIEKDNRGIRLHPNQVAVWSGFEFVTGDVAYELFTISTPFFRSLIGEKRELIYTPAAEETRIWCDINRIKYQAEKAEQEKKAPGKIVFDASKTSEPAKE